MGRMPKMKPKKQSDKALLSQVKKEMAQPRAAKSTRSEELNATFSRIKPGSYE
jgi:hypothetical protein